jgi:hypothetical protein
LNGADQIVWRSTADMNWRPNVVGLGFARMIAMLTKIRNTRLFDPCYRTGPTEQKLNE